MGSINKVADEEVPRQADGADENHRAGSLYDLIAPQNKQLRPVGEFNRARIVFQGNHGEHWLNGANVVEYDASTSLMDSLLAASKYNSIPDFGGKKQEHIILQDHGDTVWYRSIKSACCHHNERGWRAALYAVEEEGSILRMQITFAIKMQLSVISPAMFNTVYKYHLKPKAQERIRG